MKLRDFVERLPEDALDVDIHTALIVFAIPTEENPSACSVDMCATGDLEQALDLLQHAALKSLAGDFHAPHSIKRQVQ